VAAALGVVALSTDRNLLVVNANKKEANAAENGSRTEKDAFLGLIRAATKNAFGV
jgi:hypothetical protein